MENQPFLRVPGAVLMALALLVAMHIVRTEVLDAETSDWLSLMLAFIPARYSSDLTVPGGDVAAVTSFVSYALVHADYTHLAINSLWLLAFGGAIARRAGAARFWLLAIVSSIAGAATFLLFNWSSPSLVVGASGAVAGLMGAVMRFLFSAIDGHGFRQLNEDPQSLRRMPLSQALTDRRVIGASVMFIGINVLAMFGINAVEPGAGHAVAWEAHVGGYLAGLLLFGFFDVKDRIAAVQPPFIS